MTLIDPRQRMAIFSASYLLLFGGSSLAIGSALFAEIGPPPTTNDAITLRLYAFGGIIVGLTGLYQVVRSSFKDSGKLDTIAVQLESARSEANGAKNHASDLEKKVDDLGAENRKLTAKLIQLIEKGNTRVIERTDQNREKIEKVASALVHRPRALVVDDDEPTCQAMMRVLQAAGFQTCCAGNLTEARAQLHPKIALVVVDVNLGGESGLDLVADIRNQAINAKVAVITGSTDEQIQIQADQVFADLVVVKPIDPAKFVAQLHAMEELAPRPHAREAIAFPTASSSGIMPVMKP